MENKKNPKLDLSKKRGMFFNIGLALSMLLVLASFEWKSYESRGLVVLDSYEHEFEKVIDIPNTVIPPPPKTIPAIIEVPEDEVIKDEVKLLIDTEFLEDFKVEEIEFDPIADEKVEKVLIFAEKQPEPIGGMGAFYKYVAKNLKYPGRARKMGVQGRVFVQFIIDKDGSVTEVSLMKGIGGGCNEEAMRVLEESPKWSPGKQRGRPVRVQMVLPITFQLN